MHLSVTKGRQVHKGLMQQKITPAQKYVALPDSKLTTVLTWAEQQGQRMLIGLEKSENLCYMEFLLCLLSWDNLRVDSYHGRHSWLVYHSIHTYFLIWIVALRLNIHKVSLILLLIQVRSRNLTRGKGDGYTNCNFFFNFFLIEIFVVSVLHNQL